MNEYLQDAKESFAKIFSSLSEEKQKDLFEYYDVRSIEWFYRMAKEKARNVKYWADRRWYGQWECGYYFSKNDDSNADYFEEMWDDLAKKYLDVSEAYFDMLYEMEEA